MFIINLIVCRSYQFPEIAIVDPIAVCVTE